MNIHEHQAKEILKEFGAPVSNGFVVFSLDEIKKKINKLTSKEFVLKAQIHAGGRGKAGGVKLVKNVTDLEIEAKTHIEQLQIYESLFDDGYSIQKAIYFVRQGKLILI